MKQTVKLLTTEGNKVRIVLENWGSGLDRILRRWTLEDGYWQCVDTGELAQAVGLAGPQVLDGRNPDLQFCAPIEDRHPAGETVVHSDGPQERRLEVLPLESHR